MHVKGNDNVFVKMCTFELAEYIFPSLLNVGRAIAQAMNPWFPTAAARVRAWVWSSGICGGQSGGFDMNVLFVLCI
jgi:hypothetical protein